MMGRVEGVEEEGKEMRDGGIVRAIQTRTRSACRVQLRALHTASRLSQASRLAGARKAVRSAACGLARHISAAGIFLTANPRCRA